MCPSTGCARSVRHPLLPRIATALALLLGTVLAAPLEAQETLPTVAADTTRGVTLVGFVRDTMGQPLRGAEVRVGEHYDLSAADGRFMLEGVVGDTLQLVVRRIGYLPAEVLLALEPDVRGVELAVTMVPAAVQLGTIVIEGRQLNNRLWQNGYYDREKRGIGTRFGPDYLERFGGTMAGLLGQTPSVSLARDPQGRLVALGRQGGRECPLNVFLDGILLRWANEVGLDAIVNMKDVLAIEVYPRETDAPFAFSAASWSGTTASGGLPSAQSGASAGTTAMCGSLLIWTKPF